MDQPAWPRYKIFALPNPVIGIVLVVLGAIGLTLSLWWCRAYIYQKYAETISSGVVDRSGNIIRIEKNNKGYYALEGSHLPDRLTKLILIKEDRYFPIHPGVNPISMLEMAAGKVGIGARRGSSTITQQTAKLLLQTETHRTIWHKIVETELALVMEIFESKEDILLMYANSVYVGNQVQGIETASRAYFDKGVDQLSTEEALQILVALNNPSFDNPYAENNIVHAKDLAKRLGIEVDEYGFVTPSQARENMRRFLGQGEVFELRPWLTQEASGDAPRQIRVSIDRDLNERVRSVVRTVMPRLYTRDAHHAAVVILDTHTGDILTLVGSPDPHSSEFGHQINMLTKPRQVASTIKPFVYAKAFESGMRPYTLIHDREEKYVTADNRILYPKNFDGKYHGIVTAAYALANSINVPAIKTLEYVGFDHFSSFLASLGYTQTEKVVEHQLGTALGTIDMDLLELTHYYSIFPNQGTLRPLRLFPDERDNERLFQKHASKKPVTVMEAPYTQLITKILSNRYLAIDQFGYTSNLHLPLDSYALKTGTTDDYRDSWVIGYTPDFVVGVWVGNADNTPTQRLSGQTGAGEIWSSVMQLMADTPYNRKSTFAFDLIRPITIEGNEEYALPGDAIPAMRRLFLDDKSTR